MEIVCSLRGFRHIFTYRWTPLPSLSVMEVVDTAIELGTTYFKNGNYPEAKGIFTRAIRAVRALPESDLKKLRESKGLPPFSYKLSRDNRVVTCVLHPRYTKLLDNLTACYEKMGNLERALVITDNMLECDPYNIKCYIRRGKVLQLLGKDQDAYKNYKLGLRNVQYAQNELKLSVPPMLVEVVKKQLSIVRLRLLEVQESSRKKRELIDPIEEHQRQLKTSRTNVQQHFTGNLRTTTLTRLDLIAELPVEVLPLILSDFSPKELLKLGLVSKVWRQRILSFPELFQQLDLNRITYRNFNKFINFFINELGSPAPSFSATSAMAQRPLSRGRYRHAIRRKVHSIKLSSRLASEEEKIIKALFTNLRDFRCDRLVLSLPSSTPDQFAKYIPLKDQFCTNVIDLSLILSLNTRRRHESLLLSRFRNLTNLELIFDKAITPLSTSSSKQELSNFQSMDSEIVRSWSSKLRVLKLICDRVKVSAFPLDRLFHHAEDQMQWISLQKLYISGVTLSSTMTDFRWLSSFPNISELWLENNAEAKLSRFLELLKCQPVFTKLKHLTFRESFLDRPVHLEPADESFHYHRNLKNLISIDLTGCSISGLGLTRLISYTDKAAIRKLNIGDCPNIVLRRFSNLNNPMILPTYEFFHDLSNLQVLLMPQLGSLNDDAMNLLIEQIEVLQNLTQLDLSFNTSITGVSVYQFVISFMKVRNGEPLDFLNIDGCNLVSHITVNMLKAKRLVNRIDCSYERESWRLFGINSFKYR